MKYYARSGARFWKTSSRGRTDELPPSSAVIPALDVHAAADVQAYGPSPDTRLRVARTLFRRKAQTKVSSAQSLTDPGEHGKSSYYARLRLSFSRSHLLPHGYGIRVRRMRRLARLTQPHHLGASPGAARMWRLMAHGTLPGRPHGLLLAWPRWEHLSHRMWRVTPIPGEPYNLLITRIAPWRGKPVALGDGREIVAGDMVAEMHCNNEALLRLTLKHTISPYRAAREDLRVIANWLRHDTVGREVKAFFGLTLLATAAARLGFTVRQHPVGIRGRLDRMFMTGLLVLYTPDGLDRLGRGTTLSTYPQEVWMSREELIRRYGGRAASESAQKASPTLDHPTDQL